MTIYKNRKINFSKKKQEKVNMTFQLGKEVEKIALQYTRRLALVINDDKYSYKELLSEAYRIKTFLEESEEEFIGIECKNEFFIYAGILGVLLAGKAYVPLHPELPTARIKSLISQTQLKTILCADCTNVKLKNYPSTKLVSREELNCTKNKTQIAVKKKKNESKIAYVLSTSGSTGEPKLVPISHINLQSFFSFYLKEYIFKKGDRFLQVYDLNFDVSVFSIFMPWLCGASCIVPMDGNFKPYEAVKTIQKWKVTVTSMVPGMIENLKRYFPEIYLPSLKYSFFSGDALHFATASAWKKCVPKAEIHNFYGPTETTIVCSRYILKKNNKNQSQTIVPLGKSFPETKISILKNKKITFEKNVKGEIMISGPQVFSGYLGNTTKKYFIYHSNEKWYKSGDRGYIDEKGNLIFLGRIDCQLKVNGYRIEPAEIQNIIFDTVKMKSIVFPSVLNKNKLICALELDNVGKNSKYKVLKKEELKKKMNSSLPEYMKLDEIFLFDVFPENTNGKVDTNKIKSICTNGIV